MSKPKLRAEARINFMSILHGSFFPFQNCLNCINFVQTTEICKKYNQRPPAEVICYGCEMHEDNEDIPF